MDVNDSREFQKRLIVLGELLDAKLSPAKQALYFEALRDLPFEAVLRGLNDAAKTCTFMPKPAELRKLAVGDVEDAAEVAWMGLRQAMKAVGAYGSLVTQDPALGQAVLAVFGSWPEACSAELSDEMWASKRKEFGRVYRVFVNRQLVGARYLPGLCEAANAGRADWLRFVPVHVLEGDATRRLEAGEADQFRGELAARASGFSQLRDSVSDLAITEAKDTA